MRFYRLFLLALPLAAQAFSIGEPRLGSRLGEKLQLEVTISGVPASHDGGFGVRGLQAPGTASALPYFLDPLSYTAELRRGSQGQLTLSIHSHSAILEPAVRLLLDITDGNLHFVRQLDVLLDPSTPDLQAKATPVLSPPRASARTHLAGNTPVIRKAATPAIPEATLEKPTPAPLRRVKPDDVIHLDRHISAIFLRPGMFALQTQLASISSIRHPLVDSLKALQAEEPERFQVDWMLDTASVGLSASPQAATDERQVDAVHPTDEAEIAPTRPETAIAERVDASERFNTATAFPINQPLVAGTVEHTDPDPSRPWTEDFSALGRRDSDIGQQANRDQATPLEMDSTPLVAPSPGENSPTFIRNVVWLLLGFIGVGAVYQWWAHRNPFRIRPVSPEIGFKAPPPTASDMELATRALQSLQPTIDTRAASTLRRIQALRSNEHLSSEQQRELDVAEAMAQRGRVDQANGVLSTLHLVETA